MELFLRIIFILSVYSLLSWLVKPLDDALGRWRFGWMIAVFPVMGLIVYGAHYQDQQKTKYAQCVESLSPKQQDVYLEVQKEIDSYFRNETDTFDPEAWKRIQIMQEQAPCGLPPGQNGGDL